MYKLVDVYRQAETDEVSIKVDGPGYVGRLRQGIKITKEENIVEITYPRETVVAAGSDNFFMD